MFRSIAFQAFAPQGDGHDPAFGRQKERQARPGYPPRRFLALLQNFENC